MAYTFFDKDYLIYSDKNADLEKYKALCDLYNVRPLIELTEEEFKRLHVEITYEENKLISALYDKENSESKPLRKNKQLLLSMQRYFEWSKEYIRILQLISEPPTSLIDDIAQMLHGIIAEIKSKSKTILYLEHMITATVENPIFSYVAETSLKTAILAVHYGIQMKFTYHQILELGQSALMQNIGLLSIPKEVVLTEKKLEEFQKKLIMSVPIYSYKIAKQLKSPPNVCNVVLQSRESVDGSGYPLGLSDEQLHKFSKIISVCSCFTSIISDRSYRKKHNSFEAMATVLRQANKKFSQEVVQSFVRIVSMFPLGCIVEVNGDRFGIVVEIDQNAFRAPFVSIVKDNGKILNNQNVLKTKSELNKIVSVASQEVYKELTKTLIPTLEEIKQA